MFGYSQKLLRAVAFLSVLLLVACGGGGSSFNGGGTGTWQYTAMGDSLAVGILASQGYVVRYQGAIETDTGKNVTVTNLGQNGWTSGQLLQAIKTDSSFRTPVSNSEVVTWDAGGNDLLQAMAQFINGTCGGGDNQDCLRAAVATFGPNWDGIVAEVLSLRSKDKTIIRTMDLYNPFVASLISSGQYDTVEPYLDQVNAHIAASCTANGIPMAKVHEAFNGADGKEDPKAKGYLAIDNIHPNDNGHAAIAQALRATGYAPLK